MTLLGRTVEFVVEGREIYIEFDALVKRCSFFEDFFQKNPSCERIVLHHAAYVAVDAVLQNCTTGDDSLFHFLFRNKGPRAVSDLLSLLELGINFGLDSKILEQTVKALAKHINPGNVVRVLRSCICYYNNDNNENIDEKLYLRLLKKACCQALPPILRGVKSKAEWKDIQTRYSHALAQFKPIYRPKNIIEAPCYDQIPSLSQLAIDSEKREESFVEQKQHQSLEEEQQNLEQKNEIKEIKLSKMPLLIVREAQQWAVKKAEESVLEAERELQELQRRCADVFAELEENESFLSDSNLYVSSVNEAIQDVEDSMKSIAAALTSPGIVRRSLLNMAETNERERTRLDAAVALGESRLRAVQRQITSSEASIKRLNEELNCL